MQFGTCIAQVASCFMGLFDVVFDALIFSWLHDAKPTGNVVFVRGPAERTAVASKLQWRLSHHTTMPDSFGLELK